MLSKESMDKPPSHIKREKDKAGEEEEARPKEVNYFVTDSSYKSSVY